FLTAATGALCAVLAYRSVLGVNRPTLSNAARRRHEQVEPNLAAHARATSRPSRALRRTLLTIGFIAGPLGAAAFSLQLLGLGLGSQSKGALPLLALLLSPAFVLIGWVLAAGKKELVLFLRRFGNEALNDSVRELVQTVLRKR